MNNKILAAYTNAKVPGAFAGISGFIKNSKYKNDDVEKVLLKEEAVTMHKPLRKKFVRNRFLVSGIDDVWQADLVDLKNLKFKNRHFEYVLTCIDVFSKFAWAIPIKKKTAKASADAFKRIFESGRKPNKIQVDEGNEFRGECSRFLREQGVDIYYTVSTIKAGIVERFNRTLKERMWRMFTYNKNNNYVDYLQDIIYSYNHSYHRSIKTKPANVNKTNENKVFINLYGYNKQIGIQDQINLKFKLGDYVRISKEKNIFEKGYTSNWSKEIYYINKIEPRVPPVYIIKALDGKKVPGVFYQQQIQKVPYEEWDYDLFEIFKETNNQLLVQQINSERSDLYWVDRDLFLQE